MNQFRPTITVRFANKNRYKFEYTPDKNIDTVTFIPWHRSVKLSWQQSLQQNYTDGVIILHKGKIVYQQYFAALIAEGTHALMSISKTLTGTLGALLIAEGLLSENKTAACYVPELSYSVFAYATIGQILDMTTALQFSETYSDPNAEI
jgi:CubicO group peptidase (beta-lactamase class C family)